MPRLISGSSCCAAFILMYCMKTGASGHRTNTASSGICDALWSVTKGCHQWLSALCGRDEIRGG